MAKKIIEGYMRNSSEIENLFKWENLDGFTNKLESRRGFFDKEIEGYDKKIRITIEEIDESHK